VSLPTTRSSPITNHAMRRFNRSFVRKILASVGIIGIALTLAATLVSCQKAPNDVTEVSKPEATPKSPEGGLEITFTYGSEKKAWIEEATAAFNAEKHAVKSGRQISVTAIPLGSGDCIDELLNGGRQADITSPASAAFIKLGNAESRVKTGEDLLGDTQNLVLSPVVIAMWKPMAEAIGWGKKPVGLVEYFSSSQGSAWLGLCWAAAMGTFSVWSYASRIEQQRADFADGGSLCRRG
jgi:Bacterial extracellular solute-binding protein